MAISNNPFMKGIRGAIGKQLVYRIIGDKQIVSAYPERGDYKPSPAQIVQNDRMAKANIAVKMIKNDDEKRNAALLRLNVTRNKLHHALLKEELLKLRNNQEA